MLTHIRPHSTDQQSSATHDVNVYPNSIKQKYLHAAYALCLDEQQSLNPPLTMLQGISSNKQPSTWGKWPHMITDTTGGSPNMDRLLLPAQAQPGVLEK
jgi:hypothetical protein